MQTAATNRPTVDDLISLDEASKLTGLKVRTLSQYVTTGRIPSLKIAGYARMFDRRAILNWMRQRGDSNPAERVDRS